MRILSITPNHDASICVLNDGVLELYLKEERFSRIKKDHDPYLSLIKIFNENKQKIDLCVIASTNKNEIDTKYEDLIKKLFKCPIKYMCDEHHKQHAALAFENSEFENALVFVIDRNGTKHYHKKQPVFLESESVFICNKDKYRIEAVYKNYWSLSTNFNNIDSLIGEKIKQLNDQSLNCTHVCRSGFNITKVYESATTLISQHPLENGKTMGLSSYGNPIDFPNLFCEDNANAYMIPKDQYFTHTSKSFSNIPVSTFLEFDQFTTENLNPNNHQLYSDYAKHVQNQTQEQVLKFIKAYVDKTGINNVIITGGYGMNIVSNSYYIKNLPHVNFYFEPLSDDSGNSIGAAIYFYKTLTKDYKNYGLKNTFFHGYEYDLNQIEGTDCTYDDIASLLLEQKSVAVYYGLAESGQRALGNRSILFDATNPNAKNIVNRIKCREWYRPFAAIVLEEDVNQYFDMLKILKNEFMTNSFQVKEKYKDLLKGIVHVDGSCRIQTINKNSHLYELLCKIKDRNGIGILLNTSLNLSGEPLVETPEEAIQTLKKSFLDVLWFPKIKKYVI